MIPPASKCSRTTDPSYRTSGNAGTGTALADLTRSFELIQTGWYRTGADTIRVLTAPEGITFEVNQKMFCTGLIVHAPGAGPSASYLPFLPERENRPAAINFV